MTAKLQRLRDLCADPKSLPVRPSIELLVSVVTHSVDLDEEGRGLVREVAWDLVPRIRALGSKGAPIAFRLGCLLQKLAPQHCDAIADALFPASDETGAGSDTVTGTDLGSRSGSDSVQAGVDACLPDLPPIEVGSFPKLRLGQQDRSCRLGGNASHRPRLENRDIVSAATPTIVSSDAYPASGDASSDSSPPTEPEKTRWDVLVDASQQPQYHSWSLYEAVRTPDDFAGRGNKADERQAVMFQWQGEPMRTSLTRLAKPEVQLACKLNQKTMSLSGDRDSRREWSINLVRVFDVLQSGSEELRVEWVLQLCKFLTANPSVDSKRTLWRLFAMCLCVFPLPGALLPFLLRFLRDQSEDDNTVFHQRALQCYQAGDWLSPSVGTMDTAQLLQWLEDAPRTVTVVKPDGTPLLRDFPLRPSDTVQAMTTTALVLSGMRAADAVVASGQWTLTLQPTVTEPDEEATDPEVPAPLECAMGSSLDFPCDLWLRRSEPLVSELKAWTQRWSDQAVSAESPASFRLCLRRFLYRHAALGESSRAAVPLEQAPLRHRLHRRGGSNLKPAAAGEAGSEEGEGEGEEAEEEEDVFAVTSSNAEEGFSGSDEAWLHPAAPTATTTPPAPPERIRGDRDRLPPPPPSAAARSLQWDQSSPVATLVGRRGAGDSAIAAARIRIPSAPLATREQTRAHEVPLMWTQALAETVTGQVPLPPPNDPRCPAAVEAAVARTAGGDRAILRAILRGQMDLLPLLMPEYIDKDGRFFANMMQELWRHADDLLVAGKAPEQLERQFLDAVHTHPFFAAQWIPVRLHAPQADGLPAGDNDHDSEGWEDTPVLLLVIASAGVYLVEPTHGSHESPYVVLAGCGVQKVSVTAEGSHMLRLTLNHSELSWERPVGSPRRPPASGAGVGMGGRSLSVMLSTARPAPGAPAIPASLVQDTLQSYQKGLADIVTAPAGASAKHTTRVSQARPFDGSPRGNEAPASPDRERFPLRTAEKQRET